MQIEIGKVYKCGNTFVYIECKSPTLEGWQCYSYIGIECNKSGRATMTTRVGRYHEGGYPTHDNPHGLQFDLEELPKRETIQVGDSVFYKDEFEAATKNLKRVDG